MLTQKKLRVIQPVRGSSNVALEKFDMEHTHPMMRQKQLSYDEFAPRQHLSPVQSRAILNVKRINPNSQQLSSSMNLNLQEAVLD